MSRKRQRLTHGPFGPASQANNYAFKLSSFQAFKLSSFQAFKLSSSNATVDFPSVSDNSHRLSVIVPCFNEAPTVVGLLHDVRAALPESQVIVVDDGSSDETPALLATVQYVLNLRLVQLEANCGKGVAFRRGLECADREFTVIQDADLEYRPIDLIALLEQAIQESANNDRWAAVYGSRYLESVRLRG